MFEMYLFAPLKIKNQSINYTTNFIFFFFFYHLLLANFKYRKKRRRIEEEKFEKRWLERSNKESRVTAVARIKHPVSSIGCLLRISLFPSAF